MFIIQLLGSMTQNFSTVNGDIPNPLWENDSGG